MKDPANKNFYDKDLEWIINKIKEYFAIEDADIQKISKAFELCKYYHKNQLRESGESYYKHPVAVAKIIAELKMDPDSIVTALLHDTVEDTSLTLQDISQIFGSAVSNLVSGVTKITQMSFKSENIKQAENFRKLILALSQDIRVLVVKLSDRLHNMRTLKKLEKDKKIKLALETLEIYAPLAGRIGLQQMKLELQDIAFGVIYYNVKRSITYKLNKVIGNDYKYIEEIISTLKDTLKNKGIDAEICGRKKSPYSIWMKMQQKNVSFEQLSDVIAFRIIVKNVMDCYKALGIIHTSYRMVPDNFQDFISLPKSNEYQSIHTIVIGPLKQKIEIQIRTKKMHDIAEYGLAAHWMYKEHNVSDSKQYEWVSDLLNIVDQNSDPEEFLHNTKLAIYYDQIFCFTPNGKIISLPKDAKILDFAYSIDKEIGNKCIGALVNGVKVENTCLLNNGDQVKIITSPSQNPSKEWLNFVVTGKARSAIQQSILLNQEKNLISSMPSISASKTHGVKNLEINTIDITKSSIIDNLSSNFIKFAECCSPIRGDAIIGIFNKSRGIEVHVSDCKLLAKDLQAEDHIINLLWSSNEKSHTAKIKCVFKNTIYNFANIINILEKNDCRLLNLKIGKRTEDMFELFLDIQAHEIKQIELIIGHLQIMEGVESVAKLTL
jgi:guanosine-3',5'-bis(diphosphate) 3'-pyrophosphohydrolase